MAEKLVKFVASDLKKLKEGDILRVHFPTSPYNKTYHRGYGQDFSKTIATKINPHTFLVTSNGNHKQDDILIVGTLKEFIVAKANYNDFFVIENTLLIDNKDDDEDDGTVESEDERVGRWYTTLCLELIDSDARIYIYPLNGLRQFHNIYNKFELYKQVND